MSDGGVIFTVEKTNCPDSLSCRRERACGKFSLTDAKPLPKTEIHRRTRKKMLS
jgi:hypothetical protein